MRERKREIEWEGEGGGRLETDEEVNEDCVRVTVRSYTKTP